MHRKRPYAATFRTMATGRGLSGGGYFEWQTGASGPAAVKYYSAGSNRVAMRQMGVVTYLFGDHLPPTLRSGGAARGSTSVAYDDAADTTRRQGYTAFGTERYRLGGDLPTRYQFTGQRGFEEIGLQYYGARWYDGALGRFSQADTYIPTSQGVQGLDRYAYVNNSPITYNDPTGHAYCPSNAPGALCINDNPDPVNYPPPSDPSTTTTSNSIDTGINENAINFPEEIDTTLGNNITSSGEQAGTEDRPSVEALIAVGIPLTLAITFVELGFTGAEAFLAILMVVQPETIPAAVPLELLLVGTSLALQDIEIAYWAYTIRVASNSSASPVEFELLPPWGFGDQMPH